MQKLSLLITSTSGRMTGFRLSEAVNNDMNSDERQEFSKSEEGKN